MSATRAGRGGGTYHGGLLTSGVGHRDERKIEVVQVYFALCLELMEEVEEAECEGSTGTGPGCREPASAKKLAASNTRTDRSDSTEAISDPYRVDTRSVEQGEVCGFRWERAGTAVVNRILRKKHDNGGHIRHKKGGKQMAGNLDVKSVGRLIGGLGHTRFPTVGGVQVNKWIQKRKLPKKEIA